MTRYQYLQKCTIKQMAVQLLRIDAEDGVSWWLTPDGVLFDPHAYEAALKHTIEYLKEEIDD